MERIVIVEDDVFLREELQNILEKEGYSVECISSFDTPVKDIISAS
ncbi:MAG: DNA-binding response regulator, partial [Clostridiales bacterium]|nr:DNA-binding response regulator [Clostridiales bacterium]